MSFCFPHGRKESDDKNLFELSRFVGTRPSVLVGRLDLRHIWLWKLEGDLFPTLSDFDY